MNNPPDIDCLLTRHPCPETEIVEAMVANYRAGCYRLACSILNDPDEAEDAIQQAFLSAAVNLDNYQPGTDFKAWIFTITVNKCLGMLRKRKARRLLNRVLHRSQIYSPKSHNPEDTFVSKEATVELWEAVGGLDEKHRLVVVLRFGQNLTVSEIARILSIREKTVYTRLYNAFRILRSSLATDLRDDWQEILSWEENIP